MKSTYFDGEMLWLEDSQGTSYLYDGDKLYNEDEEPVVHCVLKEFAANEWVRYVEKNRCPVCAGYGLVGDEVNDMCSACLGSGLA